MFIQCRDSPEDEVVPTLLAQTGADRPSTSIPKAVKRYTSTEKEYQEDPSTVRRTGPGGTHGRQKPYQQGESSEELSMQSFITDLSMESDQLFHLLGEQGVRKLGSKLAKLQRRIDRQREHHRRRMKGQETESAFRGDPKQKDVPVMASTPASSIEESIEDNRNTLRPAAPPTASVLSPVLETSRDVETSPTTSESTATEQRHYYQHPKRGISQQRHKDDFHITYSSSELQSDTVSEASVPCTCRPARFKRSRSLHDIARVEERQQAQDRPVEVDKERKRREEGGVIKMQSRIKRESRLPTRIPAGPVTPGTKSSQLPPKKRVSTLTIKVCNQIQVYISSQVHRICSFH